jgi:DNA polymerase delta subunit 2
LTIEDLCYYNEFELKSYLEMKIENPLMNILNSNNSLMAFVSDFGFGSRDSDNSLKLARNVLIDFFQGNTSKNKDLSSLIKRINKLVVVGDLINCPEDTDNIIRNSFTKSESNNLAYKLINEYYCEADKFMNILSNTIKIDLLPGQDDLSDVIYPKKPLHKFLLPNSAQNNTICFRTCPFKFKLNSLEYIITSGYNIEDISKFTYLNNTIDLMKKCMLWGSICPTASDTLKYIIII